LDYFPPSVYEGDIFIIKIETMKKIIRLTESDLTRIVKRVIKENNAPEKYVFDVNTGEMVGTHRYGVGFVVNRTGERMGYESHPTSIPNGTKMKRSVEGFDDEDFSSLRNNRMSNLYEELGDENSCEDFISRMRDIYEETQSFISRKSDKIRKSDEFRKYGGIYVYNVYEILEDQLGYIVDMAEEMECDNFYDLLEMYEEYTETIAEILGLDKTKLLNL